MKYLKLFPVALLFTALTAQADHHEGHGEMKAAAETACAQDAATAGCGDKKIGTGLMKCLRDYKKANKDFKFSDSCKAATKDIKTMRKEHRAKKGDK